MNRTNFVPTTDESTNIEFELWCDMIDAQLHATTPEPQPEDFFPFAAEFPHDWTLDPRDFGYLGE